MRLRAATRALFIAHWWLFRWTPRVRKSSFVGTYPLSCSRPPEIPSWLMYETFLRIGSPRTSHSTLLMKLYTGKRHEIVFCCTCYMLFSRIFYYYDCFWWHTDQLFSLTRFFWLRSNNSLDINVQLYFLNRDNT